MRITAYVHIRRTLLDLGPTGVGKHINEVVRGLAGVPDVDLQVLGAQKDTDHGCWPPTSGLAGLPLSSFRWPRKLLELSWQFLNSPKVERWTGPVDWIYCPAEAYVARRQAKLAVAIHSVYWLEPNTPWYNDAEFRTQRRTWTMKFRRLRSSADLLLPMSNFLAQRLSDLVGVPADKMRVVGNGVEEAYFSPAPLGEELRKRVGDQPFVLVVGGLTKHRGSECILETARLLHDKGSRLRIVIAGVGQREYEDRADEIPNVLRLGYLGIESGLPSLMRESVALFLPSLYETFGIPAAEAMAAGTPAVVSHCAALPEVVGSAGVIVDPSQPAAIADVLTNLSRDAGLRSRYVAAGKMRAQDFRWNRVVERTFNALREFSGR